MNTFKKLVPLEILFIIKYKIKVLKNVGKKAVTILNRNIVKKIPPNDTVSLSDK